MGLFNRIRHDWSIAKKVFGLVFLAGLVLVWLVLGVGHCAGAPDGIGEKAGEEALHELEGIGEEAAGEVIRELEGGTD